MYMYIYIYICVCVGLSVLLVASGIIFSIFEAASESLEDLFCLLWREDRTFRAKDAEPIQASQERDVQR